MTINHAADNDWCVSIYLLILFIYLPIYFTGLFMTVDKAVSVNFTLHICSPTSEQLHAATCVSCAGLSRLSLPLIWE